jgi:hypothetical protein
VPQRLERLPAALRSGQGRPVVLVLPAGLAGPGTGTAAFTVAGCVGYVVGQRFRARGGSQRASVAAGNGREGRA